LLALAIRFWAILYASCRGRFWLKVDDRLTLYRVFGSTPARDPEF
jgi:hypothetical protein